MDAIERTISYLSGSLGRARVAHDVPADRRDYDRLVTVSRLGGPANRFLDEPRMGIDCYATTSAEAYALAMEAVRLIDLFPERDPMVSAVGEISLYRNQWTEDGTPCYSISCSLTVNQ